MNEVRLAATADLHLDVDGLEETVRVARRMTEAMAAAEVNRALFAGDTTHRKQPHPDVWAALAYILEPLALSGTCVDFCAGTHDCLALGAEHSATSAFAKLYTDNAIYRQTGVLAHNVAELQRDEELNILWLPHAVLGRFAAAYPDATFDQTVEGAKAALRGLVSLPPPNDGRPSIIVGHWSPHSATRSGSPTKAGDLPSDITVNAYDCHAGYACLILGHEHKPQHGGAWTASEDATWAIPGPQAWVVPGAIEQRTWADEGEEKSWCLLRLRKAKEVPGDPPAEPPWQPSLERIPTGCRERLTARMSLADAEIGLPGSLLPGQFMEPEKYILRVQVEHREGEIVPFAQIRDALDVGPAVEVEGQVTERREVVRVTAMRSERCLLENLDESLTENPPEPPEIAPEVMGLGAELVQEVQG